LSAGVGALLLGIALTVAVLLAAGLSGAAAALFTANRFRLRNRARDGSSAARAADRLLTDPAALAVLLALLQTVARIASVALAIALGRSLGGDGGVLVVLALAAFGFTLVIEMYPRAAALQRPDRWAMRGAHLLLLLQTLLAPLTRSLSLAQRGLLGGGTRTLPREHRVRARAVAAENSPLLPEDRRRTVADQVAAESATVSEVMVPRTDIGGLDLDAEWPDLVRALRESPHRLLPVWRGSVDAVEGVLDTRRLLPALLAGDLTLPTLRQALVAPYFVPGSTSLPAQLVEFQRTRSELALVVDEYGEVQGLVTLTDVVAELATLLAPAGRGTHRDARPDGEGTWLVAGSVSLRSLNRGLGWDLPVSGPRTLNGLILEYLESIPTPGTSLRIGEYTVEVVQTAGTAIRTARITPPAPDPRV
jgi:Mg2+/Co2+ transporter CorB